MNRMFQGLEKQASESSKVRRICGPQGPRLGTLCAAFAAAPALALAALVGVPLDPAALDPHGKVPIPVDGPSAKPVPAPPDAPALWFPVGEVLTYSISWGHLPVGEARAWTEWVQHDGRVRLAIRMRMRTNQVLSTIYPVDDFMESIVDPATFLPLQFVKKINEGRSRHDQLTTFDRARGAAHWVSNLDGREHTCAIAPDTRCIVSLAYWLRKEKFRLHETREFQVMADEKVYALQADMLGIENISVSGHGRVPSLKIEPRASFGGIFTHKGKLWMWASEDPRRIATMIAIEVPVARVRLSLDEVSGPGDDFWVKKGRAGRAPEQDAIDKDPATADSAPETETADGKSGTRIER